MSNEQILGTRVAGKIAIVCGAGSSQGGLGNGMAAAVLLAREGAKVLGVDVDLTLMDETAERITAFGGTLERIACDISDEDQVRVAISRAVALWGGIDILVNNVGIQGVGGPVDVAIETWDRLMEVNAKGMFLCCRHAIPHMVARGGGSIVNVSSLAGIRYSYPAIAYMASKGAVQALTTGIGMQYAPDGIRCNAVLPGYIQTERITKRLKTQYGETWQQEVDRRARQVPSGKLGDPWDIGYAVLYLASDEAKFVNGAQLVVDGGQSMSTAGATGPAA